MASKDIGQEVKADNIKYKVISRDQNTGRFIIIIIIIIIIINCN